jgi:hypothetical protein
LEGRCGFAVGAGHLGVEEGLGETGCEDAVAEEVVAALEGEVGGEIVGCEEEVEAGVVDEARLRR